MSFSAEQARRAADELRSRGILEETLVLSTCNRSEVYGVPPESSHECAPGLSSFLSEFHAVRPEALSGSLYHHYDREAVRHLFRVSAGLDSMLLGEAEILGQVREAYRFAHEQGATGPVLNRVFRGALEVGKRVRTETERLIQSSVTTDRRKGKVTRGRTPSSYRTCWIDHEHKKGRAREPMPSGLPPNLEE